MQYINSIAIAVVACLMGIHIMKKFKTSRKNKIIYSEDGIEFPKHMCRGMGKNKEDDDLTFEEMEKCCEEKDEDAEIKLEYIKVNWNDIQSWRYGFYRNGSTNKVIRPSYVALKIKTNLGDYIIEDAQLYDLKKYFKKHIPEKQKKDKESDLDKKLGVYQVISIVIFVIVVAAYTLR